MRIVLQRVTEASVKINNTEERGISSGLVVLLGIEEEDGQEDIDWLVRKILNLRIFDDQQGVMNLSVMDISAEILLISQFTLHASTKKGNRPSYIRSAKPEIAVPLYEAFVETLKHKIPGRVKTGEFGANMKVSLINNGPVTIVMDSKNKE